MSMYEWAKKEVEIACKKENPERKDGEFDYGCTCYQSALKAFKSLCDDGHSGMSISITKNILNRLIDGNPLTPIEDTEDIWRVESYRNDELDFTSYQCSRMFSLFKYVYDDGRIEYSDNDSFVCCTTDGGTYHYRFIEKIATEYVGKITMPYSPLSKPIHVYANDYLYNPDNGDFDTIGIFSIDTPDKGVIEVNRYFKFDEQDYKWVEIDKVTFDKRVEAHEQRLKESKEND